MKSINSFIKVKNINRMTNVTVSSISMGVPQLSSIILAIPNPLYSELTKEQYLFLLSQTICIQGPRKKIRSKSNHDFKCKNGCFWEKPFCAVNNLLLHRFRFKRDFRLDSYALLRRIKSNNRS